MLSSIAAPSLGDAGILLIQLLDDLISLPVNRGEHPLRRRHEVHVYFPRANRPWIRLAPADPLTPYCQAASPLRSTWLIVATHSQSSSCTRGIQCRSNGASAADSIECLGMLGTSAEGSSP